MTFYLLVMEAPSLAGTHGHVYMSSSHLGNSWACPASTAALTRCSHIKTNHNLEHIPSQLVCRKHSNIVVDMYSGVRDRGCPIIRAHCVMTFDVCATPWPEEASLRLHMQSCLQVQNTPRSSWRPTLTATLTQCPHIKRNKNSQHIPSQLLHRKHSSIVVDM